MVRRSKRVRRRIGSSTRRFRPGCGWSPAGGSPTKRLPGLVACGQPCEPLPCQRRGTLAMAAPSHAVDRERCGAPACPRALPNRSEEHTSELQSLMRISYAVFCLKKKKIKTTITECYLI